MLQKVLKGPNGVRSGWRLLIFIAPGLFVPLWPWTLTALTGRVLGAMFALPGVLSLEILLDPRWSFARRLLEAQFVSLVMFIIAILRSQADIDAANPFYPAFLALILVTFAALVVLFARMQFRGNRKPADLKD